MRADAIDPVPELSIVIPAYNASETIQMTLKSLEEQTASRGRYEIIVVDDGSNDDTLSLCLELAEDYGNIRAVHQENSGVSAARNAGIALARGKWLCFADSDDLVTSDYVQTMLTTCPESDYVIFDHLEERDGNQTPVKQWLRPWFGQTVDISQVRLWICDNRLNTPWDKRFSLTVVRANGLRFPEGIHMGEDLLFNFQYSLCVSSACVSGQAVYIYADNAGGLSHKQVRLTRLAEFETVYHAMQEACRTQALEQRCRGATNLSFLRVIARYAGQLHDAGFSGKVIAEQFDGSKMVKSILKEPARSAKNMLRKLLLKLRLYGVCSAVLKYK